jgi:hypothetical protein
MNTTRFLATIICTTGILWTSKVRAQQTTGRTPNPDHYGSFGVSHGSLVELRRLTGEAEVMLSTLRIFEPPDSTTLNPSGLYFVTFGQYADARLERAEIERSGFHVTLNPDDARIRGLYVDLQLSPIRGENQMLRLTPRSPLSEGVYLFSVNGCPDNIRDNRCYYPLAVGDLHRIRQAALATGRAPWAWAVRHELERLLIAERAYFVNHHTYVSDLSLLQFTPIADVVVSFQVADARGFYAFARDDVRLPTGVYRPGTTPPQYSCSVYVGRVELDAEAEPSRPKHQGSIECERIM